MSNKIKATTGKKRTKGSMQDKYWRQVMVLAEGKQWAELTELVTKQPWLATASIGRSILPDYLAGEKDYSLLRLLCNAEDVPIQLMRDLIARGAKDAQGRAYLERLLVGAEIGDEPEEPGDVDEDISPVVAAAVLATCNDPAEVIGRMQQVLEQGLQDESEGRRKLAEKCIGRSQVFYDLLMLLEENDALDKLKACLANELIVDSVASGKLDSLQAIENMLSGN
ncbi:hypothetical protein [Desulfosediminicola flagellatus]|uniref:hypothetical protein n=1 Tax=Desulfosediminicola flagellatus TaxID=2569541 RepID=UPI0010AD13A7|nr:hypothetical protein [Desulfosediminicola flagellatus]